MIRSSLKSPHTFTTHVSTSFEILLFSQRLLSCFNKVTHKWKYIFSIENMFNFKAYTSYHILHSTIVEQVNEAVTVETCIRETQALPIKQYFQGC